MTKTEAVTETLPNGNTIKYDRLLSGTCYHRETPDAVRNILENARQFRRRVRLFYGDTKTGRDRLEENDVSGFIGRSTGNIKIPLLLPRSNSSSGPGILDHCIVKIIQDGRTVYEHPKYWQPEMRIQAASVPGYTWAVNIYTPQSMGQNHANFKSYAAVVRYVAFMTGKRMTR
jgi:hypothetical protein